MMILCSNSVVVMASDRHMPPVSLGKNNNAVVRFPFNVNFVKFSDIASKVMNTSVKQLCIVPGIVFKGMVAHPKVACAITSAGLLLLLLAKWESINKWSNNSEAVKNGKKGMSSCSDYCGEKIDSFIDSCPFPANKALALMKMIITWCCCNVAAIEGKYFVGAMLCPVVGYINGLIGLIPPFGIKAGCGLGGMYLGAGWYISNIAKKIAAEIKIVGEKVDEVGAEVREMHTKVSETQNNVKEVLKDINNVQKQIDKVSEDVKNKIDSSSKELTTKMDQQAQEARNFLKEQIVTVNGELQQIAKKVKTLPSKKDVDDAIATLGEKFQKFVDNNVNTLAEIGEQAQESHKLLEAEINSVRSELQSITQDVKQLSSKKDVDDAIVRVMQKFQTFVVESITSLDRMEEKLRDTDRKLEEGFNSISIEQKNQTEVIKSLEQTMNQDIEKRGNEINSLKEIIELAKFSSDDLLNKFVSMETGFTGIKVALENNKKEYDKFIQMQEAKYQLLINEQRAQFEDGFKKLEDRLKKEIELIKKQMELNNQKQQEGLNNIEQKIDTQHKDLSGKINSNIQQQQEFLKQQQEQKNILKQQEETLKQQQKILALNIKELENLQESVAKLHEDIKRNQEAAVLRENDLYKKLKKHKKGIENKIENKVDEVKEMLGGMVTRRISTGPSDKSLKKEEEKIFKSLPYYNPANIQLFHQLKSRDSTNS